MRDLLARLLPRLDAAVEQGDAVEALEAEVPPQPRGPDVDALVDDDDVRVVADAQLAEVASERVAGERGERGGGVLVGEVEQQVGEDGARDVALAVGRAARRDLVVAVALRLVEEGRRVHDGHGVTVRAQPGGVDEQGVGGAGGLVLLLGSATVPTFRT
ncbi:MAG TPA: hypothetical protein VGE77_03460 [Nocardioides sp.]